MLIRRSLADSGNTPITFPRVPGEVIRSPGPQSTELLRRVLNEVNVQPHSAENTVGYFYLPGFAEVATRLRGDSPERYSRISSPHM